MRRLLIALLLAATLNAAPALPGAAQVVSAPLWPHTVEKDGASVTVYQPQAISWPDEKRLTARAALAITPKGATEPIVGTVDVAFDTTVDTATRSVALSAPQLLATHFPSLDTGQATALQS